MTLLRYAMIRQFVYIACQFFTLFSVNRAGCMKPVQLVWQIGQKLQLKYLLPIVKFYSYKKLMAEKQHQETQA